MTEYKEVIYDIETGETTERLFTNAEIEIVESEIAAFNAKEALQIAEAEKQESAKSALLQKLGITKDEAKLLLS